MRNADNSYKISKSATQGTGAIYDNGNVSWVIKDVQPLIDYLGNNSFSVEWKNVNLTVNPSDYLKYFVLKNTQDPSATFLGEVNLRKY
ncbi:hypothetical protein D3C86_1542300 [compost metagenome]